MFNCYVVSLITFVTVYFYDFDRGVYRVIPAELFGGVVMLTLGFFFLALFTSMTGVEARGINHTRSGNTVPESLGDCGALIDPFWGEDD